MVVGYSLPKTDLPAQALFRLAGYRVRGDVRNHIDDLIIVNPDSQARRRTIEVFRNRLIQSSRVIVFDKLEEFSRLIVSADADTMDDLPKHPQAKASGIGRRKERPRIVEVRR